jgi:hypothetical protein
MTTLFIAFASLWLTLPAAAQSEIDPDHFDDQGMIVVQPGPMKATKSVRVRVRHNQVQRDRVQAFKRTTSRTITTLTSSSAAAVQPRRRIGTSRVGQTRADTKPTKQSRVAASHVPYECVPQSACSSRASRRACKGLRSDRDEGMQTQGSWIFAISPACSW